MKEEKKLNKFLEFLGWVILLGLAIAIPALKNNNLWWAIAGSIPLVVKFAYDTFDSFNLLANRTILWILNKDVAWEMKASFRGNFDFNDIENILLEIKKLYTIKIIQVNDLAKTFNIPEVGMVINITLKEVRTDEDEFSTFIVIAVERIYVSFKHNTRTLNLLISIIDDVVKKCIDTSYGKFEFKAFFVTSNPYFGLFLRRLKVIGIPQVNISYREREGANEGQVEVMADKISLITKDIHSLQALSRKYITLSSLNLSET
jgi:hypothetical protein